MLTLFYPPFRAETSEEFLEQSMVALRRYVDELGTLSHDELRSRWSATIRTHKTERWPTIAEILGQTEDTERTDKYISGMKSRQERERRIETLLHDVLYNGALGRQAARERWPDSLRIFIQENAREPLPHEIARMRRGPAEADECMADFERRHAAGEDIFGIERLRGIHQAMIERNARLAEQIEKQEIEL